MLKGVNDSPADAKALARSWSPNIPGSILFRFWPGAPIECSSDKSMSRFAHIPDDAGSTSPVRTPRAHDIMAACGQLRSAPTRALGQTEAGLAAERRPTERQQAFQEGLKKMRILVVVILALCAATCSSGPIVDMKDVDEERYERDLAECRQYADQVDVARSAGGGALLGAAGGAAGGAAVGAVVGAITGSPGTGAAVGGGAGGTSGLFAGGAGGANKKERVVRNCLRGRGYSVLD